MAIIKVNGTVQLSKSGSSKMVVLWETKYVEAIAKDIKTMFKLVLPVPADWTDGTWVEVEGEEFVAPQYDMDGNPKTYLDKNGHSITAHERVINNVVIKQAKIRSAAPEAIDLDDARKYGTTQNNDLLEAPF